MPRLKPQPLVGVSSSQLSDYPRGLAFSPDARWLAAGAADGTLRIARAADGAVVFEATHPDSISALAFSPTSSHLAVAGLDGVTRLYEVRQQHWVAGPVLAADLRAWVEHLAWSSTGVLATVCGKKVVLWDERGTAVGETAPHASTVSGVAFSRDGKRLFTASYGGVQVWSLGEGPPAARPLPWSGSLISIALSPDDSVVACGSQDCSVHFWRLKSGRDSEMSGYPSKPTALAWSDDSHFLATGGADVICVWRFAGGGPEGTKPMLLKGHEGLVTRLAFLSGHVLASSSEDGDLRLWSLDDGDKPVALVSLGAPVTELCCSADASLLAAATAEGHLRVWSRAARGDA